VKKTPEQRREARKESMKRYNAKPEVMKAKRDKRFAAHPMGEVTCRICEIVYDSLQATLDGFKSSGRYHCICNSCNV